MIDEDATIEQTLDPPAEWAAAEIEAALHALASGTLDVQEARYLAGLGYAGIERSTGRWVLTEDGRGRLRYAAAHPRN